MRIVRFVVRGRVQGVGFRAFTVREAVALGLAGWVRNVRDGTVEGVVGGDPTAVNTLLAAIAEGPPASEVTAVSESAAAPRSLPRPFQVMPTADRPSDS